MWHSNRIIVFAQRTEGRRRNVGEIRMDHLANAFDFILFVFAVVACGLSADSRQLPCSRAERST